MKKYLIVYYSQTGQTQHVASIIEDTVKTNSHIDYMQIKPKENFPFPWGLKDFFGVFKRSVLGRGSDIEIPLFSAKDYDMVFVLAQVWFLSPSLPIQGFFQSPAASALHSRKVHLVLTSRNMWLSAAILLKEAIDRAGGNLVKLSVLEDTSPAWLSFITTPMWLVKGRKQFLGFREAGIDQAEYQRFKRQIEVNYCADPQQAAVGYVRDRSLAKTQTFVMEMIGRRLFEFWARLMDRTSHPLVNLLLQIGFRLNLVGIILVTLLTLPIIRLFFNKQFDRLVERRFSLLGPNIRSEVKQS